MSGVGENRSSWRQQGRGNRTSGSNNPNKDTGRQPALSGNAWKSKGAGGTERAQAQAPSAQAEPQHVPVNDFNASDVKHYLKKRMFAARSGASRGLQRLARPSSELTHVKLQLTFVPEYLESVAGTSPSNNASSLNTEINRKSTDQPSAYHKVQGDSVEKRSSGAWGSRGTIPHLMPSGQDFFTQLKKQLAALDQGKPS